MIQEIYLDNFRCFSNFKIQPSRFQLWIGGNGSGKSSIFETLRGIQGILEGIRVQDRFSSETLTAWDRRTKQTFGLALDIEGEAYAYELTVEHFSENGSSRISRETLRWQGRTFFLFEDGEAHLFRIDRRSGQVETGARFPASAERSVIPTIAFRDDNLPLIRFRREVGNWMIVQPIPLVFGQRAEIEEKTLSRNGENFARWYRHVLQEEPGIGYKAREWLRDPLPEFEELSLRESGDTRKLTAIFRIHDRDLHFEFGALSDGQKQLIFLYTILEFLRRKAPSVLLIDEPDNFVSVREIQPWIEALREICETEDRQAVVISHHPEVIDNMARGPEIRFSRKEGGQVVIGPLPKIPGLTPAETMARGWDDA